MKTFLSLSITCLLNYGSLHAVEKPHSLVLHPLTSVPIQGFHISYESLLGDGTVSYEVPAYFGYTEYYSNNPRLFLGSGLEFRRYLFVPGRGTYVSSEFEFLGMKQFESGYGSEGTGIAIYPNLRMGYKFQWNYFVLDLGVGVAYIETFKVSGSDNFFDSVRGFIPWGNFSLGVPF